MATIGSAIGCAIRGVTIGVAIACVLSYAIGAVVISCVIGGAIGGPRILACASLPAWPSLRSLACVT